MFYTLRCFVSALRHFRNISFYYFIDDDMRIFIRLNIDFIKNKKKNFKQNLLVRKICSLFIQVNFLIAFEIKA
jgi:hypothetical protein